MIASLGAIPPEAGFTAAELTRECDAQEYVKLHPELEGLALFRDSDSHYLETLAGALGHSPCQSVLSRLCWTQ